MSQSNSFEEIGRSLASDVEEVRYRAVSALADHPPVAAVPLLLSAVGDRSWRVREQALGAICLFPPEVTFPRLASLLRDNDNAELRTAALEAFPRYGRRATSFLLELLRDADEEIRNFSAVMLGEVMDPDSVEGLVAALSDPDENVKHAAAEALGRIGDSRALPALLACLDQGFWVQYPAVIALGNIGEPAAVPTLIGLIDHEMLRSPVIEALGKTGDAEVMPVLVQLLALCRDSVQRDEIIAALVKIQTRMERGQAGPDPEISAALERTELVEHLVASLHGDDLEVKKNSIIALGWLRQARAAEALLQLLPDYELEEHVVSAVTTMGERAVSALVQTLADPDPAVRVIALRCLGCIEDRDGCRSAVAGLDDPEPEVRLQALMAVASCAREPEVEEALLNLLGDPDPEIRAGLAEALAQADPQRLGPRLIERLRQGDGAGEVVAIRLLGRMKFSPAMETLRRLFGCGDDEVRAEALSAMAAVSGSLPLETVRAALDDPSPQVRRALAQSITEDETAPREDLMRLLRDPDPGVRATALESLGRSPRLGQVVSLIETACRGDRRTRLAAVRALGNTSDRAAGPFLVDLLKEPDPDLKRNAIESLARLRDGRALPGLIVALEDSDWSVRAAAAAALGALGDLRAAPRLIERLKDSETIVCREAVTALAELKYREAANHILPLLHNDNLQLEVLGALERLGIEDYVFFANFLRRANSRLRGLLVDLLGRLRDPSALGLLTDVLNGDFYTVRCRAARALGEIGDRRAVPPLVRSQREDPSEDVRREAALALTRLDAGK